MTRRLLVILTAMAATIAMLPGAASAHSWPYYWTPGFSIGMWVDGNRFPLGDPNYVNRVIDGMNSWNAVRVKSSEPIYVYKGVTPTNSNFDTPCASQYNGIVFRDIPAWGLTNWCRPNNGPHVVQIMVAISSNKPWYRGTGALGSQYYDLWSVASHEFGHGLGAPHFDDAPVNDCNANLPSGVMWTMCPGPIAGDTRQRRPGSHDRDTFHARY